MTLTPRLAWRKWRLRNQPVPRDGKPLSATEAAWLDWALFGLLDEEGTRRLAVDEEAAELRAAAGNGGGS